MNFETEPQLAEQAHEQGEPMNSSVIADITARARELYDRTEQRLAELRAEHSDVLDDSQDRESYTDYFRSL